MRQEKLSKIILQKNERKENQFIFVNQRYFNMYAERVTDITSILLISSESFFSQMECRRNFSETQSEKWEEIIDNVRAFANGVQDWTSEMTSPLRKYYSYCPILKVKSLQMQNTKKISAKVRKRTSNSVDTEKLYIS